MDNNALPAVPHLDVLEPGPPSAQGIYFLIAAALSVVLMAGMTLYYGLKDRQAVENNGLDAQVQAVLRQEARAEVFEDIARDTVILLIAQGAGFMIWRASGRKHPPAHAGGRSSWRASLPPTSPRDCSTAPACRACSRRG